MAARGERARQIFTPGRSPLTWFSVRLPSPFPTTWGKRSSNAPKCARCLDAGNHLGRKAPGPETLLPDAAPGTPGPGLLTPGVDLDAGAGRSGCGRWGGGGLRGRQATRRGARGGDRVAVALPGSALASRLLRPAHGSRPGPPVTHFPSSQWRGRLSPSPHPSRPRGEEVGWERGGWS